MHEGSLTILLSAELSEIERLNRLVRKFGELHDLPARTLYAVHLALDEVVTNVLSHGLEAGSEKTVKVFLETRGPEVRSVVTDEGRAFNPLDAPMPDLHQPLTERELGGLGIHLVRSLMDGLDYRREDRKNVLTMWKRIR